MLGKSTFPSIFTLLWSKTMMADTNSATTTGDRLRSAVTARLTECADVLALRVCDMLKAGVAKTPVETRTTLDLGVCSEQFRCIILERVKAHGLNGEIISPCTCDSDYGCRCTASDSSKWVLRAWL